MTLDPSLALGCRMLGVLLFATAAVGKVKHRHELAGVVANYHLLPERLAAPVAWTIIGLESLTALSLASGVRLAAGAALGIALLGVFALAIGINLARGRREIDCGCFQSGLRQTLSTGLLVRNLLLSAALVPLFAAATALVRPLQWVDGLGAGFAAYAIYRAFDQLLSLRQSSMELRKRFV
ncbi:MAG: MauE/DoxX family redox-associated membrane protein [Steroidobacteraceae bacterium]